MKFFHLSLSSAHVVKFPNSFSCMSVDIFLLYLQRILLILYLPTSSLRFCFTYSDYRTSCDHVKYDNFHHHIFCIFITCYILNMSYVSSSFCFPKFSNTSLLKTTIFANNFFVPTYFGDFTLCIFPNKLPFTLYFYKTDHFSVHVSHNSLLFLF